MIWTRAMLYNVERLGLSMSIDPLSMDLANVDVKEGVQQLMARRMVDSAHPLGVEIHPEDVRFREIEGDFGTMLYARWAPSTTVVEFRGGHVDGQIMTVAPQLLRGPIMIPRLAERVGFKREEDGSYLSTPVLLDHLQYDLAGWHETQRHWLYDFSRYA